MPDTPDLGIAIGISLNENLYADTWDPKLVASVIRSMGADSNPYGPTISNNLNCNKVEPPM